jgi:NADH:ubiquinone oxidoreductase subunit 6 (subunit J)
MWNVVRAELEYDRFAYVAFFMTAPRLVLFRAMGQGADRAWVLWFVVVMLLNYWNARRIREKREYLLAQLPVSRSDVGRARAFIIVLLPAAYLLLYVLIDGALGRGGTRFEHIAFVFGFVVTLFAALMMFRDRFAGTRSLIQGKVVLIAVLGALFALGLVTMIMTEDAAKAGAEPPAVVRAIDYAIKHSPLGNPVFEVCFVAASLLVAWASVITFTRRRNNFE